MEKEDVYTASFCPSFSSYSGDRRAETAERVRFEFSGEHSNTEFAFVNLGSDFEEAAIFSSDCNFVFPIFNKNISAVKSDDDKDESSRAAVTTQLRDLLLRDREDPPTYLSSFSDEEEHELDGISSEIYCPWTPENSPNGVRRKRKSTGSPSSRTSLRRWRIRDLLKRSYREEKQSRSLVNSNSKNRDEPSKMKMKEKEKVCSAHEKLYLKNKEMKEEEN